MTKEIQPHKADILVFFVPLVSLIYHAFPLVYQSFCTRLLPLCLLFKYSYISIPWTISG